MREFNPVLVKELRGRVRGARAFVLLTAYLVILSGMVLLVYISMVQSGMSELNIGQQIGQALFFLIGGVALAQVCLITPLLTAGSISGEKERQSYDLLVSSLLSPWQIVWGKLGAAMAYAGLLVLGTIPLISVAFLFGGVSLSEVVVALAALLATALVCACVGLCWSSVTGSSMVANALSLGTVLLVLLGLPLMLVFSQLIFGSLFSRWSQLPLLVYVGGTLMSAHPFIALYLTEVLLREDQGLFYVYIDMSNGKMLVPSPWLVYVALTLAASAFLLLVTVRRTRPEQSSTSAAPRRRSRAARGAAGETPE